MNIEEYISSGVVEAYVLGLATEAEVHEIRELMERYPELRAAVREHEDVLIRYAEQKAVSPPEQLKQAIWNKLNNDKVMDEAQPVIVESAVHTAKTASAAKRIRLNYAMAASLVLLVGSIIANAWLLNRNNIKDKAIADLTRQQKAVLHKKNEALAAAEAQLSVLSLPRLVKINLAGVGVHSAHSAMLYWDKASGNVFLDLNGMPQAPAGKQYQLWAIVDGKPVDAGIYSVSGPITMVQMKAIARAEVFAITIENEGGSPTPSLDQMVVAGKTS